MMTKETRKSILGNRDTSKEYKEIAVALWDYVGKDIQIEYSNSILTKGCLTALSPEQRGRIMVGKTWVFANDIKEIRDKDTLRILYLKTINN